MQASNEEAIQKTALRIMSGWLIYPSDDAATPIRIAAENCGIFKDSFLAAAEGVERVVDSATLPYMLISTSIQQRNLDRFLAAARIRELKNCKPGTKLDNLQEARATEVAHKKLRELVEDRTQANLLRDQTIHELDFLLLDEKVSAAASETLYQATISIWSVFESFTTTFIRSWVNEFPNDARALLNSSDFKRFLVKTSIELNDLFDHNLDLSRSLGTVLLGTRRLDNLQAIRAALKALFASPELNEQLGGKLWVVSQQRHLIVHKRGFIDKEYTIKTGHDLPIGSPLPLTGNDIEDAINCVRDALVAIADVTASRLASQ